MKIIVISDSFKGTLSSSQIREIARGSIPKIFPGCSVAAIPVADGSEGTVRCFLSAIGAEPVTANAGGPYGERVDAVYARKGSRAIVEVASAAGLPMAQNSSGHPVGWSRDFGTYDEHLCRRDVCIELCGVASKGKDASVWHSSNMTSPISARRWSIRSFAALTLNRSPRRASALRPAR